MNKTEPEVMRMLREIREKRYEEIKDLTPAERVGKVKAEAEACIKRAGLKIHVGGKSKHQQ